MYQVLRITLHYASIAAVRSAVLLNSTELKRAFIYGSPTFMLHRVLLIPGTAAYERACT